MNFSPTDTIIGRNVDTGGQAPDCSGPLISYGYNLIQNTSSPPPYSCNINGNTIGNKIGFDPDLGPLQGSPGYHPLLPGSPTIDGGNPAGCVDHLNNPLNADQRGISRVGRCDIGSYEFDPNYNPLTQVFLPLIVR